MIKPTDLKLGKNYYCNMNFDGKCFDIILEVLTVSTDDENWICSTRDIWCSNKEQIMYTEWDIKESDLISFEKIKEISTQTHPELFL